MFGSALFLLLFALCTAILGFSSENTTVITVARSASLLALALAVATAASARFFGRGRDGRDVLG